MDQIFEMKCTCPPTRWQKGAAEHDPGCPIGDFISGKLNPQSRPESAVDEIGAELLASLVEEKLEPLLDEPLQFKHQVLVNAMAMVLEELERRAKDQPMGMLVSKLSDGQIRVDFSKKIKRFDMKREHAVDYAILILNQCGVALEIKTTLPPPAGDPV